MKGTHTGPLPVNHLGHTAVTWRVMDREGHGGKGKGGVNERGDDAGEGAVHNGWMARGRDKSTHLYLSAWSVET